MIRDFVKLVERIGGMKRLLKTSTFKSDVKSVFFISITVLVVIELVRLNEPSL